MSEARPIPMPSLPAGYLPIEEAAAYVQRRFGSAVTSERLRQLMDPEHGPKPYTDEGGETYYRYDEIDLWVYRKLSGLPASWRDTQGRISTMPMHEISELPASVRRSLLRSVGQRYQRDEEQGPHQPDKSRPDEVLGDK